MLKLRTAAQRDAAAANAAGGLPVLLFAPGLNWLPTDYSTLLEELASQGYVVVAWAPPQYAGVVQQSSGRLIEGNGQHDHAQLVADFRFVRQQLGQLNESTTSPLRGRLSLSRVGALGHSIGGAAAVGAAQTDPQILTAANLDGDFDDAETAGNLRQPVLYLTTEPPGLSGQAVETWDEKDRSEARRQRVWAQVSAPARAAYRVRLPGFYHSNFQDAALLPPAAVPAKLRQNRFGRYDGAQGLHLTGQLLTAFFNAELRQQPIDSLLALRHRYPAMRIEQVRR
jgi:predicted dienelactone hydrolase